LAQKNRVLVIFLIFIFFNRKFCQKFEATEKEKKVSLDCYFFHFRETDKFDFKKPFSDATVASNKG